ncbi:MULTISPECIES: amino acid ABC transporter permease [unclassified Brenneria]|uniref:amino acid ABC transporter permease n=1 Tax=unclassified Brenneria TaxID=2634434 RepID=UPI0029C3C5E6|nr:MULTISPECIES: amino acid ABC transporter permease [unclassified Brenneria]MDX5627474.1 amino acid ABC transporter permease [Brenneria sp. L3-3Z]MDX5694370.1 amino acid ABC transporter permease [Brenneria sp. L4-2C]MEE3662007.1 amino acid ABC transporter permease [Brenneria sp. g21c3]
MFYIAEWFKALNEQTGWNFSLFYNAWEARKYLAGLVLAVKLAIGALMGSMLIGLLCVFARQARLRALRWLITAYVEFFRNTPGLAQLYFLFFGIGSYFHLSTYGPNGELPLISPFQFVVIALSLQYGAFVTEILRAGIEAVPRTTIEAAESLGYGRAKAMLHIILPLALRISLPALGNNMAQIVKSTALAYAIAVPEALYVAHEIWTEHFNVVEMMNVVLLSYLGLMTIFTLLVKMLEQWLKVPGLGR